jgi:hypothetical protein
MTSRLGRLSISRNPFDGLVQDQPNRRRTTMSNFVLAYTGGAPAETPEAQEASMKAWTEWFQGLGSSVVDAGNPFGASATVASDGSTSDAGRGGLTGYSIITADDLAAATAQVKGCPILADGGSVEVYEVFNIM